MKKHLLFAITILIFSCTNKQDITAHLSSTEVTTPKLFLPGIVTLEDQQEFSMTISPIDAKTILFTRRIGNEKQRIYQTKYVDGTWTIPEITSFSTDRDESPQFSKDGKTVYFVSERPIQNRPNKGNFDVNVWKTQFINNQWSTPEPLPEVINKVQKEGEKWPLNNVSFFVTADDTTFYTGTQMRGEKGLDIYQTTFDGTDFSNLEKLPKEINLEDKWEYAPIISPDGNYLFFQVYNREDGMGGDDIFVSKKDTNGNWLPSVNMGTMINTKMNECPTAMSADGKYFFFLRDFKKDPKEYDGIASIYFVETKSLQLETLFP